VPQKQAAVLCAGFLSKAISHAMAQSITTTSPGLVVGVEASRLGVDGIQAPGLARSRAAT